jgi:hypothetical protein
LPLARDCNFVQTNLSREVTPDGDTRVIARPGATERAQRKRKREKVKTLDVSNIEQRPSLEDLRRLITFIMKETRRRFKRK